MDLNTIKLAPQLLADLYPGQLIDSDTTTMPEKVAPKYLGHNEKKILVLVSHAAVPYLPDNELSFLTTVLAACKLGMGDIAIVNFHQLEQAALNDLIETAAKNVLLFGLDPEAIGMPVNFPQFQLQPFNQRNYLHAPTLSELESDKELKKQLWTSL